MAAGNRCKSLIDSGPLRAISRLQFVKALFLASVLCVALAACQSATAQNGNPTPREENGPRIVTVPPDELQRTPSLSPATEQSATPAPVVATLETPAASAPTRAAYTKCNVVGPYVAMSFDDGPHPELTPKLLDMLKERGIKATFYVVGRNVAQYPDVARRIVAEGHEIANHTWSHPSLTKLSAARVAKEIESTTEAITGATGVKPTTLRPPYGATNAALNRRINDEFGLKVAMWSVDPQDWKIRKASHVSSHIIERAVAGDIILAHDIHPSTVAAMPQTLDALAAKGLKFVTVAELMAMDRPMEVARREPQAAAAPTTP